MINLYFAFLCRLGLMLALMCTLVACGSGGGSGSEPKNEPDTTPSAFNFEAITNTALSDSIISAPVVISGIDADAAISVSNGQYSIDNGAFTDEKGTVSNGQSIRLQLSASTNFATKVTATLTIGGVTGEFSVTTLAQDTAPDTFTFMDIVDAKLSSVIVSESQIVKGIDDSVPVSITGGEYSIDSTDYTSQAGVINDGQSIQLRLTSSDKLITPKIATLTIGSADITFTVTTLNDTTPASAEIAFPPLSSLTEGDMVAVRGAALDNETSVTSVKVNGVEATDTSENKDFSTWQVSVPLTAGLNTLTVSVVDGGDNENTNAASVTILSDSALPNFPDDKNPLSQIHTIVVDNSTAPPKAFAAGHLNNNVLEIDLQTGERSLFSKNDLTALGAGSASYLSLDKANNRLLYHAGSALLSGDLTSGIFTAIATSTLPSTEIPIINGLQSITDPSDSNILIVADDLAGLTKVNLTTGERSILSVATELFNFRGVFIPDMVNPMHARGIVYDSVKNRILVSSDTEVDGVFGAIMEVSQENGSRTIFSSASKPSTQESFNSCVGELVIDSDRNRIIVANNTNAKVLCAVDLDSGKQTIISSLNTPNNLNNFKKIEGIYYEQNMEFAYIADFGSASIMAVDILTGERVIISKGEKP